MNNNRPIRAPRSSSRRAPRGRRPVRLPRFDVSTFPSPLRPSALRPFVPPSLPSRHFGFSAFRRLPPWLRGCVAPWLSGFAPAIRTVPYHDTRRKNCTRKTKPFDADDSKSKASRHYSHSRAAIMPTSTAQRRTRWDQDPTGCQALAGRFESHQVFARLRRVAKGFDRPSALDSKRSDSRAR